MVQQHNRYKTFVDEPSVSEGALIDKIQELGKSIQPDNNTNVKRSVRLDTKQPQDSIGLKRVTKELEAALNHRPGKSVSVTYSYNSPGQMEVSKVSVSLKGTEAMTAEMQPDVDTGSFQSKLIDDETGAEIPRSNVAGTTVQELLAAAGLDNSLQANNQDGLSAALYSTMQIGEESTISYRRVLHEAEIVSEFGVILSRAEIEREQTIEDGDILTSTVFTSCISTDSTSHARLITVIDSEHGPAVSVEEINVDEQNDKSTRQTIELNYEELEKLLKQVDNASLSVDQ